MGNMLATSWPPAGPLPLPTPALGGLLPPPPCPPSFTLPPPGTAWCWGWCPSRFRTDAQDTCRDRGRWGLWLPSQPLNIRGMPLQVPGAVSYSDGRCQDHCQQRVE
ncbi:unnamed protein product [Pipistrellus nathusii]|uniref:Uncharacterized protein n=1 Tax=Pipistrellus nathusii TaxID=59473 RepID=A0ABN9Z749_PIPNA